MNRTICLWVILSCFFKLNAQDYLVQVEKCDVKLYKIEYEKLYGEISKIMYLNFLLNEDTLYSIKAESVKDDTLKLKYLTLIDRRNGDEWFYSWSKFYDIYFLSSLNKTDKDWDKGISKIYNLYREDQKSIYRFSDYTQTPKFEEYYNFGEKTIDTDIILTFPKFFKEIQGVKED